MTSASAFTDAIVDSDLSIKRARFFKKHLSSKSIAENTSDFFRSLASAHINSMAAALTFRSFGVISFNAFLDSTNYFS